MRTIGPYQLLDEVGRGGAGVVHRARGPAGEEVALKLLLAGREADPAARRRFVREAEALSRLQHPRLVRVLGAGEDQGLPWLAMEWLPGESLQTRLDREGPLDPGEAVRIARDLAEGLAHVHERGLLHRDVKPANVILRAPTQAPVLTDFGLVRTLGGPGSSLSRTGQFLGSPGYWPPEQARGEKEVGAAADLYGLGALLYALLTGEPPHGRAESLVEALTAAERPVRPPSALRPGLDRGLEALVLRCLERDPARRPASAGELAAELGAWLSSAGAPASPRGTKPAALALALVTPLVLGVGLALALRARDGGSPLAASTSPAAEEEPEEELPELDPDYHRGLELWNSGDPAGGREALERALARDPGNADLAADLAQLCREQGDLAAALRVADQALATAPGSAKLWDQRGTLRHAAGDLDGARADLDRALALGPDLESRYHRALVRREQGDLDGARADLDQALAIHAGYTPASIERGELRLIAGDAAGAIEDLSRALLTFADDPRPWLLRAAARRARGETIAATEDEVRGEALLAAGKTLPERTRAWLDAQR